jgi:hypothetical protein
VIGLYLLAAHLVGDVLLQTRWQATLKLRNQRMRAQHVAGYCLPFVPIAVLYGRWSWSPAAFLSLLAVLHFATDSRRFHSTLGDLIQWRIDLWRDPLPLKRAWLDYALAAADRNPAIRAIDVSDKAVRWPTPNPWPPIVLMVDQTLHLCQLAILGGVLLR